MTLNRLLNADNECVGYFTDDAAGRAAMQAARAEWDAQAAEDWSEDTFSPAEHRRRRAQPDACPNKCRSIATYVHRPENEAIVPTALRVLYWYRHGATDVNTQHYEINRYRRPGKSNRSADLGGPEQAAGVLYVLTIKAPK